VDSGIGIGYGPVVKEGKVYLLDRDDKVITCGASSFPQERTLEFAYAAPGSHVSRF
jgi:hypothetical protein